MERVFVKFDGDASGLVREAGRGDAAVGRVSDTAGKAEKSFQGMGAASEGAAKHLDRMNIAVGNSAHETQLLANVASLVKWPALYAGAGLAGQAVGALGGAAVATVSALAPLSGALAAYPALAGGMAQATGVVKLGLSGLADAIAGDEKALAKLGPAGRDFVRSFNEQVKPLRQELTELAQGGLLPGLTRGMKAAFSPDNVGVVREIVGDTAKALGGLAAQLGQELGNPQWARDLAAIGKNNVRWMNELGGVLIHDVLPAVRDLIVTAQPMVDWLVKSAAGLATYASHAISAGRETGTLARFFEKTQDTMSLLGGILGSLGRTFLEIGKAAYPLGHSILVALNDQAGKLSAWAQSEGGKETLRNYFAAAKPLVFEVGRLLGAVVGGLLEITKPVKGNAGLVGFLARIRTEVLPLFQTAISGSMSQLGPALEDLAIGMLKLVGALAGSNGPLTVFVHTIAGMASGLADLLTEHPHLQEFVFTLAGMVGVMKALKFAEAITGLSKLSGLFATSAASAGTMAVATTGAAAATEGATAASWSLNAALRANPIGLVITALELLGVGLYEAWTHSQTFRDVVKGSFGVVRGVVSGFVDFFGTTLPGAFREALSWVKQHWPEIAVLVSGPFAPLVALATDAFGVRSALTSAFRAVKNFVGDRVDDIVGFFRDLPSRLGSAIDGIGNVFGPDGAFRRPFRQAADWVSGKVGDVVGFFSGLGGKIGAAIADGAKDILEGFKDLFHLLPHWARKALGIASPSKVFAEIGQQIVHGLIDGMKSQADALKSAAEDILKVPLEFIKGVFHMPEGGGTAAPGKPNTNQGIALRMIKAEFPQWDKPDEWGSLVPLWNKESAWSNYADTRKSGLDPPDASVFAYGIPQARPYSKMPKAAWPVDKGGASAPEPQILWGLGYIKGTYGDPAAAWAHELAYNWYDRGGILKPGATLALNKTGKTEAVLTREQMQMLALTGGGGGGVTWTGDVVVQGHVLTERDLRDLFRDELKRLGQRNGGDVFGGWVTR